LEYAANVTEDSHDENAIDVAIDPAHIEIISFNKMCELLMWSGGNFRALFANRDEDDVGISLGDG